jgi:hypothetical protein
MWAWIGFIVLGFGAVAVFLTWNDTFLLLEKDSQFVKRVESLLDFRLLFSTEISICVFFPAFRILQVFTIHLFLIFTHLAHKSLSEKTRRSTKHALHYSHFAYIFLLFIILLALQPTLGFSLSSHPGDFLDHTQWLTAVGRTPLDEWSARHRDLYPTTHNTYNRQTSMPPAEFKPAISAIDRP